MAAALFKDIIQKQQEYLEAEDRKKVTESISSAELKQLMTQAIAMGGDVNENVIKLYDEMRKQTNLIQKEQKDDLAVAEEKQEAARVDEYQTDLLEKIADNTEVKPGKDSKELGLGTIVASVVAALAGLAGAVAGYVKSIKVLLDVFTPDFIKTKLAKTLANFENILVEFGGKLRTTFGKGLDKISSFFSQGFAKLKTLLSFDEASDIGKFITSIKEGFAKFLRPMKDGFNKLLVPFTEAFNTIKNLMAGTTKGLEFVGKISGSILGTVGDLKTWIGKISGLFKGVFSVVSKLATPLFVIMTLWDTVSNVIDRFESDGIIGGFVGIFEGLFKSIVAAPLDLLKDIVSWVLGAFGFDEAEKFLDSFSFVDMAKAYYDMLLHPIDTLMKLFDGVADLVDEYIVQPLANVFAPITDFFVGIKDSIVGFFEAIEIPKIGFTIPIIDKEVSIGPFYPFRREKPAEAEVEKQTAAPSTTAQPATVTTAAPETVITKGAGVSQDMAVPAGTVVPQGAIIPPATGPETREQTEARVKGALKAGLEEQQAEIKAIEAGATINGEAAPASRQEYYKQQGFTPDQIANLNARQAKINALRSQDTNVKIDKDLAIIDSEAVALSKQAEDIRKVSPDQVEKETQAYTSKLNIADVLATPQAVSGASVASTNAAANMVYGASAENASAAVAQPSGETNNTVVAPTTVNNNTVNAYKPDVRNQDSSFRRMLDARYVPV